MIAVLIPGVLYILRTRKVFVAGLAGLGACFFFCCCCRLRSAVGGPIRGSCSSSCVALAYGRAPWEQACNYEAHGQGYEKAVRCVVVSTGLHGGMSVKRCRCWWSPVRVCGL
ncbi:unnamed protein product [Pylaiella littoralis]